ncbi:MAG: DNA cytosine methyltransferase, partial [Halothece sp.]
TEKSMTRFAETLPGKTEPVSRFFKLDPNGICNTLRAGTASNRGTYTSPRPIHPYLPRCLTVREAAQLHSYPNWFRFHVTKWHGFRQNRSTRSVGELHSIEIHSNLTLEKTPLLNCYTIFKN